jgi:hypothetical protein
MKPTTHQRCSFCEKVITHPTVIIYGPSISKHRAWICEDCVAICAFGIKDFRRKCPREEKE